MCFEVATRTEPFKGKTPVQVIGAVFYREERPEIPEGAFASPEVVSLMKNCWEHDPAKLPKGFAPLVQKLASVVQRDGDPRNHSTAVGDLIPPSAAKQSVDAQNVSASTEPLTASGSLC